MAARTEMLQAYRSRYDETHDYCISIIYIAVPHLLKIENCLKRHSRCKYVAHIPIPALDRRQIESEAMGDTSAHGCVTGKAPSSGTKLAVHVMTAI